MEVWLPQNLESFLAVGVLLSLVVVQLSVDFRDLTANQRIISRLLQKAKQAYQPKFSIIIDADQSYQAVEACLEALIKTGYKNLQIIVIVKKSAGKKAYNRVSYYRRGYRRLLRDSVK